MNTMKKRILSSAMAGVLAMSLAVPAFASGASTPNMATKFNGSYQATNIEVVVPESGTVAINPYGLGVTVDKSAGGKVALSGQVMSIPLAVKNKTNMWLNVGAQATAVLPADTTMKLAAATTKGSGTEGTADYVAPATGKSAFVQLEVAQAPASVVGTDGNPLNDLIIDASANNANWANSGKLTVTAKGASSPEETPLAVLKPAAYTSGAFASYAAGSIALFRLSGDCTSGPKAPWSEDDTFEVNVVFNFTPAEAPSHNITYALTGATAPTTTSAKEGESVTITIAAQTGKSYDSCTVEDAEGNDLNATVVDASNDGTPGTSTETINVTFTMPATDATVTAEFS